MASDYTPNQKRFAEVFVEQSRTNPNYSEVCKVALISAGYAEGTSVTEIMRAVKDLIIELSSLRLVQMIPKIINGMESVVDNPSIPGAKNIIAAAIPLLDRAGIIKKEESTLIVKQPDGILIMPCKVPVDTTQTTEKEE